MAAKRAAHVLGLDISELRGLDDECGDEIAFHAATNAILRSHIVRSGRARTGPRISPTLAKALSAKAGRVQDKNPRTS